jgi:hypothetical protein
MVRKRHIKILQLIGHIDHLKDMLPNTPTSIILSMHHLSHDYASVSLRGPLEMLLNLSHESISTCRRLRKSSPYGSIDRVVHNHQCHSIIALPLSIHLLILSLAVSQGGVITTFGNRLLRFVFTKKRYLSIIARTSMRSDFHLAKLVSQASRYHSCTS